MTGRDSDRPMTRALGTPQRGQITVVAAVLLGMIVSSYFRPVSRWKGFNGPGGGARSGWPGQAARAPRNAGNDCRPDDETRDDKRAALVAGTQWGAPDPARSRTAVRPRAHGRAAAPGDESGS